MENNKYKYIGNFVTNGASRTLRYEEETVGSSEVAAGPSIMTCLPPIIAIFPGIGTANHCHPSPSDI